MSTARRYACPDCGEEAPLAEGCERCRVAPIDATGAPAWQVRQNRVVPDLIDRNPWTGAALLVTMVAALGAISLSLSLPQHPVLRIALVFTTLPGVIAAVAAGAYIGARRFRRRRTERARARMSAHDTTRVADAAGDALVKLRGATRLLRPALQASHPRCLAVEWMTFELRERGRTQLKTAAAVRTVGGEFELDDGSGARAVVRAEHVQVAGGEARGNALVVPEGAVVEVVGHGRWEAAPDAPGTHARSAARVLRLTGTLDEPLLIRVLGGLEGSASASARVDLVGPPARTGVRVAVAEPARGPERAALDALDALDPVGAERAHAEATQSQK